MKKRSLYKDGKGVKKEEKKRAMYGNGGKKNMRSMYNEGGMPLAKPN